MITNEQIEAVGVREKQVKNIFALWGGGLLVCALVTCFFAPRFVLWQGLSIPEAWFNPEINRAVDTLKQLDNPGVHIENPSNIVINWRLLFPYLGHYLRFPKWLFLSLPQIGALLAAVYMFQLLWFRTGKWLWAFMGVSVVATSDWFFVSVGWLTYFDSWFVIGMLVTCFSRSRMSIGAACLLTPWVDERFLLALVGCSIVRWFYQRDWEDRSPKDLLIDFALIAAFVVPYVSIRFTLALTKDLDSSDYVKEHYDMMLAVPWQRFAEGFWAGFRAAWLFVIIFAVLVWRRGPRILSIITTLSIFLLVAVALFVAGDLSRSMAMLLPACLMGVIWLMSRHARIGRVVLPAVFVANLILPAEHVLTSFKLPITTIYHEVKSFQNPPFFLDPVVFIREGKKLYYLGKLDQAMHLFDNAISLAPELPEPYFCRGVIYLKSEDLLSAHENLDKALQLRPLWADALYFRGLLHTKAGSRGEAVNDLKKALSVAERGWSHQQDCLNALNRLGTQ